METVTFKYPGSIEYFSSFIDDYRIPNKYRWVAPDGQILGIFDDWSAKLSDINPKARGYEVEVMEPRQDGREYRTKIIATIHAIESSPNVTTIRVYDGWLYHAHLGFMEKEPIGPNLVLFVDKLASMWKNETIGYADVQLHADSEPIKPLSGAGINVWFDYYHSCKAARKKYTLFELAEDYGLSLSRVKALHRMYKAEKGL
ncbi:MAG: hypothetical protein HYZ26_05930 [Chloroflexi bacterium]|nr:hypothetical protein [Chloroflexota bacterium]